ncbi:sigma-70 family RNA polymerase sigma factor [Bacillus subtilis]|uniref:sigma-70 family RNA polymerase sigma factor n=1 Tax=Bacillus subtilis TaxID=1423 RepID=UPI001EE0FEB6|nr:sigma-70 family RNA polymerase sigma factor [Bacillus subtilis]
MSKQTLLNFQFLNEPIVKKFLANSTNKKVFKKATEHPTLQNQQLLDQRFKKFYKKARILKYLTTMIKVSSIDFDKRNRRMQQRFLLTLDAPLKQDEETTASRIETIPDKTEADPLTKCCISLDECITDPQLHQAYTNLNEKQKKILNLMYIEGLTLQDIATFLGDSRQNIFNIYKRSLNKLKQTCNQEN